jgi:signal transduction histidine kinase
MQANPAPWSGEILVVDDNRMSRTQLAHMLRQHGYQVTVAEDGRTALATLRAQPQERQFDVVLLDLLMPEMDGFEVLQQIKGSTELHEVVVIVTSALEEMESVVRCIELGAEDYLTKPVDPILLQARLKNTLEKKQRRDLERAYLQQEMALRQNEKLATLGKLCAGIAHELNNPAAAAQRGASQLITAVARTQESQRQLWQHPLTEAQEAMLAEIMTTIETRAKEPLVLDSLARTDREDEVMTWLTKYNLRDAWDHAADLVVLGYEEASLQSLAAPFSPELIPVLIAWISANFTLLSLASEIGDTTHRISEIVRALKSYTYMDQAPVQQVDVHRGIEDTLTILRHKWKERIAIQRDYAENLPLIEAYGSELNQAWTNLLDNAIGAMGQSGQLIVQTRQQGEWVVVTIEDNGPGIPEAIQAKIFDPFFTTKAPGEGTGLGLSIVHNIITQKHKGQITVDSQPGRTRFEIRLPIHQ